jgi:hypothetical protein
MILRENRRFARFYPRQPTSEDCQPADSAIQSRPMSVDQDLEQRRAILRDARDIAIRIRDIAATMPDSSRRMQGDRESARSQNQERLAQLNASEKLLTRTVDGLEAHVARISAVRRVLEWEFKIQASHDPNAKATPVSDAPTSSPFPSAFLTPAQMVDWIAGHPSEASQRFWCNVLVLMGCSSPSLARNFLAELDRRLPSPAIESFMAAWVRASPDLFVDHTLFFYPISAFPRLVAPCRLECESFGSRRSAA